MCAVSRDLDKRTDVVSEENSEVVERFIVCRALNICNYFNID